MRLNIQILLFTLSFVTCNSVLADNNTYAGIGFGSSSVDIASNALDDGSIITGQSTNDTDTSLSFFIGKRLSNRMSIEGGYIDLGVYSVTGFSDGSGSFWWPGSVAITIESTALYLNVVGHQEINPQLELIGKVGLYSASTDVALTDSWGTIGTSEDNTGLLMGLGLQFDLTETISGRADWSRFMEVGGPNTGGESDVDILGANLLFNL